MASNKIIREGYVIARYKTAQEYFTTASAYDRPQWLTLDEATVFLSADVASAAAKKLWGYGSLTAKVVPLNELDSLELEIPPSEEKHDETGDTEMVAAKQDATAGEETRGVCSNCECDPCECPEEDKGELSATDSEIPGEEHAPIEEPGEEHEENLVSQHLAAATENEEETARLQPAEVELIRRKRPSKPNPAEVASLMKKGEYDGVKEAEDVTDAVRRPTDAEHAAAKAHCKKEGTKAEAVGVDKKTGKINVKGENGKHYVIAAVNEADMSDRVAKSGGSWYVDREDIDSGKTVSKPGQTIKFTKAGKQYTAKVTDQAVGRDDDCYKLTIVDIKTLNEAEFKMPKRPGNDPAAPEENDATVPNLKAPYDSKKVEFKDPLITADDDDTKLSHADAEEHADKVTVPAEIKSQLKAVIADLEQAAKDTNMRDDTKGSFAMTAAAALQQLLDDLSQGNVSGIKQAQIHMTSYMNPITSYIPADVTKFIAYGGRKSSLKSYFDVKWDNVRGVK